MKKFLAIFMTLAMTFSLAACGGGSEESTGGVDYDDGFGENVLRITYDHECESGDPRQTTADYIIMLNVYDTLVQTISTEDGGSELQPGVAESWTISDDGLTYSFKLREGVMYTNGEELTADDVLYTIDSMLDPERAAVNTDWFTMLAGAQEVLDGEATTVEGVGMVIHDDYNFDLILKDSYSPFISVITVPGWSILNREACEAADEAGGGVTGTYFGSEPEYTVGSGPFILKEWKLNDHIYLEANPDYWQGAPKIDGILIKVVSDSETEQMMFETGQTDIFDLNSSNATRLISHYEESEEWADNIVYKTVFGTSYLTFNENIAPFDDVRVRKALQIGINRQEILDTYYEGSGKLASGIFPESMVGYNADLPEIEYDPEQAKALLAEAGYADGFEMEAACTNTGSSQEVFQVLQEQLKEYNITLEITQMDEASWYDIRANGELPMYFAEWYGDFNDPDNFIYTFFSSTATKTRSFNYKNEDAIARIEAARHMVDQDARIAEYQDLEKIVVQDDAAWIPLVHASKVVVVQDRVKNYIPHWAGWGDCSYYNIELELSGE